MTTEELDKLTPGTIIYVPTDWDVQVWLLDRRVGITNYYTLTHPPDNEGVVADKRPIYRHQLDLLHSTKNEQAAWLHVLEGLEERKAWIYRQKLNDK